ncbi:hypothetical protein C1N32_19655 [Vibrio diazotrophicus]|uniref:Uncharacterized protein n=1 Tax=Vibrio diazotrophicus TaxID=685 RepID=A0A2J8HU80_VIBDI|nr:hypothetical protein C1N32_19655 [Vibrio diazotrophicus]
MSYAAIVSLSQYQRMIAQSYSKLIWSCTLGFTESSLETNDNQMFLDRYLVLMRGIKSSAIAELLCMWGKRKESG